MSCLLLLLHPPSCARAPLLAVFETRIHRGGGRSRIHKANCMLTCSHLALPLPQPPQNATFHTTTPKKKPQLKTPQPLLRGAARARPRGALQSQGRDVPGRRPQADRRRADIRAGRRRALRHRVRGRAPPVALPGGSPGQSEAVPVRLPPDRAGAAEPVARVCLVSAAEGEGVGLVPLLLGGGDLGRF